MVKAHLMIAVLASFAFSSCGSGYTGRPVTVKGRIDFINEGEVSWEGLRLTLGSASSLTVNDEVIYTLGEEYRVAPIGTDHVFSFDLPAKIEDGWTGPVSANSAVFYFYAYNDTNQNGMLDMDSATHEDPVNIMLDESDRADTIFFVNDPDTFNAVLKNKVEYGWNYSHGGLPREYSQDFVREFVLTPL